MKNLFYVLAVAGVVAFAFYALPEGFRRQRVADCIASKRICEQFHSVHGGNCLECKEAKQCEKDGIFND